MNNKNYFDLVRLKTFRERYLYLQLRGIVGEETFGFDRFINQKFYKSTEWLHIRNEIIVRDNGCDLGIDGLEIPGSIIIHHMNPIAISDIINMEDILYHPEFLICTSLSTHNAIHYGNEKSLCIRAPIIRTQFDTCPWLRKK